MANKQFFSANPALIRGFEAGRDEHGYVGLQNPITSDDVMTLNGTVNKSILALAVLLGGGFFGWTTQFKGLLIPAVIVGLVLGLVTAFKPRIAPITTLPYALVQGVMLGLVSKTYAEAYEPGLVPTAIGLTICVFIAMLVIYRTGLIKPTRNFRIAVMAGTLGLFLMYLFSFIGGLAGFEVPLVRSNSIFGIGFSLLAIVLASANLVLDFDFIEEGSKAGLPAHMEWYGAFGLTVTLVWLYLEILRLLGKLQSRD